MQKGQASIEVIFAVIVLLLMLALVLVANFERNVYAEALEKSYRELNACNKLSYIITTLYAEGPRSEIIFWLDSDATVYEKEIKAVDTICNYVGKVKDLYDTEDYLATVNQGMVKVKILDLDEGVIVENVSQE